MKNALPKKVIYLLKKIMKSILVFIIFFLFSTTMFGQDESLSFPADTVSNETDTSVMKLDFKTIQKGQVQVKKSKALDEITEFVSKNKNTLESVRMEGYRIQIYFNENKSVALGQKASFLSSHSHKAYLDYLAPNYRVRVGNFRTKLEAEKLKQELLSRYPTCIVIKDHIELPKLINSEN